MKILEKVIDAMEESEGKSKAKGVEERNGSGGGELVRVWGKRYLRL